MGYFGNNWRNWGPPRGPEINPDVSIIFPILFLEKKRCYLRAGWTVTLMTSWDKGESGVLGGIKYRQLHTYVIDWFSKIHHF
jgi:hypothetical protein